MQTNKVNAYLHALSDLPNTKSGALARLADRFSSDAFDNRDYGGFKQPSSDALMNIEASIFTALCDANGVDWRYL